MSSCSSSESEDFLDDNFPPTEGIPAIQFKDHLEKLQEKHPNGDTGLEIEFQVSNIFIHSAVLMAHTL